MNELADIYLILVSITMYCIVIPLTLYIFCYRTLRPDIECPFCRKGRLRVHLRTRELVCPECGRRMR